MAAVLPEELNTLFSINVFGPSNSEFQMSELLHVFKRTNKRVDSVPGDSKDLKACTW